LKWDLDFSKAALARTKKRADEANKSFATSQEQVSQIKSNFNEITSRCKQAVAKAAKSKVEKERMRRQLK